uniref:Uncharacterized protein n=1 Tax=Ascaris lumbricoides TaxID=6252 RepID=A0A9J2Q7N4_ASCLU
MRRSNRHHPSSAAADAFSQLKTPIRSNINKRTLAESKSGGRVSWPLKQQTPLPEPRRQRAAAMVAKDAMILMTNNAVVKDLIKSPSPGKKEHPVNRAPKRASNASLSSSSSAKQTKNADNSMTLVSTNSTTENQESVSVAKQQSNDEVNTTLLDVSTTLSHDLSSFPRELTVKEVIAKSMRANRVSMRGLSRDIVGIMKDIQSKESRAIANTSQEGAIPSIEQQASTSREVDKLNADKSDQKAPLVVALEGLFGASNSDMSVLSLSTPPAEENVKDALRQDHMTVQEVINPPLPPSVPSSLSSTEDARVPLPSTVRAEHMPKTIAQMGTSNSTTERITKKKGENKARTKSDDEILVDVVGNGNSRINDANRELNGSEKILIIADFDAGMLPHELENKYNVSKMQVAEVLRNRIPIIRQQASSLSDRLALKRRRTNFVGLNIMMWRFFCDCRDQGIVLNGRQLKEHALTIARQLGWYFQIFRSFINEIF